MRNFSIQFKRISNRYIDICQQSSQSQTSSILAMVMLINTKLHVTTFHNAIRYLATSNGNTMRTLALHVTKKDMLDGYAEILACKEMVDAKIKNSETQIGASSSSAPSVNAPATPVTPAPSNPQLKSDMEMKTVLSNLFSNLADNASFLLQFLEHNRRNIRSVIDKNPLRYAICAILFL